MVSFSIKGSAAAGVLAVFALAVLQLQTAVVAAEFREFDYLVLALKWPGNSCRNLSYCCLENACCPVSGRGLPPDQFTLYGLWPEYETGPIWPSCCSDEKFNPNEISVLSEILPKVWPNYECDSELTCGYVEASSFYAAQYEKHGTCTAPIINGQYNYFSKAISLYNEYNVTRVFERFGIVASDSRGYPITYVLNAILSAFNGMPKLRCTEDGVIQELWLCLDKDFKPRDCDVSDSCPAYVRLFPTRAPWEREGTIPRIAKITEAAT